jgi:hypothetical protein
MGFSRRSFFRNLGIGAAVGAVTRMPLSNAWSAFADATANKLGNPILLNKNENAYGPSEKVRKVINAGLSD